MHNINTNVLVELIKEEVPAIKKSKTNNFTILELIGSK